MNGTLKLAVFGDPVEHSLSPAIHGRFAQALGLNVDYGRIRSGIEELPAKIVRFAQDGGRGANLTVPLKQAGLRLCSQLDRAARQARAVNTLKWSDGQWHGYNTDGAGLLLDLERLNLPLTEARILIIGAGGATAGILGPLLAAGPARVHILNRTEKRALALAERFEHLGSVTAGSLDQPRINSSFDLLLQATSIGHEGQLPPIERQWLSPQARVYDLNYGSAHGPVELWCEQQGLGCHDGLGMLIGQAALAFEIWTGQRPAVEGVLGWLRGAVG
jgi:shikimate dehydrogenase